MIPIGEAAAKGAAARSYVVQHYSLAAVAQKLLAQILRVQVGLGRLVLSVTHHTLHMQWKWGTRIYTIKQGLVLSLGGSPYI